ncbi:MAG: flagellar hook-basal body complex protein [Rhodospirillaceae bacterium]|nr:flagellar hook-basal body complex protein [Rhodospirillaceae bacterium]
MSVLGGLTSSMLGMMTQSKTLDSIGLNIANVNTAGYKTHDTQFQTILSRTASGNSVSDLGGVKPVSRPNVILQGEVMSSERDLDIAIFGEGFFVLNTERDGSGETLYTRDGSFQTVPGNDIQVPAPDGSGTITTQEKLLIDKNGYYVMGWEAQRDGLGFDTTGAYAAMRIDPYLFQEVGIGTTEAKYIANLPSQANSGDNFVYNMEVFDSDGGAHTLVANFTKGTTNNQWDMTTDYYLAPTAQVTSMTLSGSVEAGDTYNVDVGGQTVSYNVNGTEPDMNAIRDALVAAINGNAIISQDVTASAGAAGEIILTANVANNPFTATTSTAQGLSSVSQTDTVTLTGPVGNLDSYTITIGADTFTYNAAGPVGIDTVRDNLVTQIGLNANYNAVATAAGQFTVTAIAAGGTFTLVPSAFNGDGVPGNDATTITTTTGYLALTDNAISTPVNTVNSSDGLTTTAPVTLTFDSNAKLITPSTVPYDITWADGSTTALDLDISEMTQYTGDFYTQIFNQDGYGSGTLQNVQFNEQGHVMGQFSNSFTRPLYQLSLAIFANPNEMEQLSGNLFKPTKESGTVTLTTAGENGFAIISPNSKELSNVDVAEEFAKMIVTQGSYNASATVFRTIDEMTVSARDLKR